ncbi:unnamed protein product, partial [Ectocarpus sp. 13 AM-2016]
GCELVRVPGGHGHDARHDRGGDCEPPLNTACDTCAWMQASRHASEQGMSMRNIMLSLWRSVFRSYPYPWDCATLPQTQQPSVMRSLLVPVGHDAKPIAAESRYGPDFHFSSSV